MTHAKPIPPQLYLASSSPRRQELLQQAGIGFHQLVLRDEVGAKPDVDESVLPDEAPDTYVQRVCLLKLQFGWSQLQLRGLPPLPVLAADTAVCLGQRIFGKPTDAADAVRIALTRLAGRAAMRAGRTCFCTWWHSCIGIHGGISCRIEGSEG